MKKLRNIKHIIWDWNGTLLDDVALCIESINSLLCKRGLPALSKEEYLEIFRFPVRSYYELAGFDFSKEEFKKPALEFISLYNQKKLDFDLHAGARSVLEAIQRAGIRQYLLSASESKVLHHMLEHHNIQHYFKKISGLDNHFAQSKTAIGKGLLNDMTQQTETVLLIGDTCHDMEVARELGIQAVAYTNGHYSKRRLLECSNTCIDSLDEVLTMLQIK